MTTPLGCASAGLERKVQILQAIFGGDQGVAAWEPRFRVHTAASAPLSRSPAPIGARSEMLMGGQRLKPVIVHRAANGTHLHICRSASVLLNRYGDGASLHAANRADAMLAAGDMDGRAVWLRIHEAVLELGRAAPGEGERVQ